MPRCYFALRNGATLMDEDGEDLPDHDAAWAAAVEMFAETIPGR